jgi:hypothetical protein
VITVEDCIALCGLNRQEVMAIAEHEDVPEIAAAAMARYLLKEPSGPEKIRDMMRDDFHDALSRGERDHVFFRMRVATRPRASDEVCHLIGQVRNKSPSVPFNQYLFSSRMVRALGQPAANAA